MSTETLGDMLKRCNINQTCPSVIPMFLVRVVDPAWAQEKWQVHKEMWNKKDLEA